MKVSRCHHWKVYTVISRNQTVINKELTIIIEVTYLLLMSGGNSRKIYQWRNSAYIERKGQFAKINTPFVCHEVVKQIHKHINRHHDYHKFIMVVKAEHTMLFKCRGGI